MLTEKEVEDIKTEVGRVLFETWECSPEETEAVLTEMIADLRESRNELIKKIKRIKPTDREIVECLTGESMEDMGLEGHFDT